MKIIFGSANHWTSPFQVGSHAWARLFASHGWSVGYFSDPLTPWHCLGSSSPDRVRERWALSKNPVHEVTPSNIRAWVPFSLLAPQDRPFFRSDWVMDHWHELAFPSISRRLQEWSMDPSDIFWLDSVRHWAWAKKARVAKRVFRIADLTSGFSGVPRSQIEAEKRALQESDLVIVSAKSLEEVHRETRGGRAMVVIRNGVDTAFWGEPVEIPMEYQKIPEPRVVYVGAVDSWFDHSLVQKMANALPKVSFVMIGPVRDALDSTASPSNLHWLGVRPRSQVRGYVQHAQAGIIPFLRNELIEHVCPLKLYEYMACGLPVVATRWRELELMHSPGRLAEGVEEWVESIRSLLGTPGVHSEKFRAYARENDWKNRWMEWETARRQIPG